MVTFLVHTCISRTINDKMVLDSCIIPLNLSRSSRGPGQSSRMIKRTIKNSFEEFRTFEPQNKRSIVAPQRNFGFDDGNIRRGDAHPPPPAMNAAPQHQVHARVALRRHLKLWLPSSTSIRRFSAAAPSAPSVAAHAVQRVNVADSSTQDRGRGARASPLRT